MLVMSLLWPASQLRKPDNLELMVEAIRQITDVSGCYFTTTTGDHGAIIQPLRHGSAVGCR